MNNRTLLHVLLIASLCFSQLAANVHMVGHFHESHNLHHHASHVAKTRVKTSDKISAGRSSSFFVQNFVESYARAHHLHSVTPLSTEPGPTYRTEQHSTQHSSREHRTVGDHELQHHTTNHRESVDQSDKVNKSDSHNNLDCAIYHAYLGQSGCLAAFTAGLATDSVSINNTPVTSAHVATTAVFNRPIRAPPSPS